MTASPARGVDLLMHIAPESISTETKALAHIHRDAPDHYVSTIEIDILYGDELEKIGEAKAFEVRMGHIENDGQWSLFDVFDGNSGDLSELYEELFADDQLIPVVEDELGGYGNIVLIKSIVLKPEFRGTGWAISWPWRLPSGFLTGIS